MSTFFPYTPEVVLNFYSTLFNIDLTSLTTYENLLLTILSNMYFYITWFILIYFALKIFNRIWERFF